MGESRLEEAPKTCPNCTKPGKHSFNHIWYCWDDFVKAKNIAKNKS